MKLIVNQAYENMGLAGTQLLGPILDGLMRNTPDGLAFVQVAEREGVERAVAMRDGPFGDYSQAPADERGSDERHPPERAGLTVQSLRSIGLVVRSLCHLRPFEMIFGSLSRVIAGSPSLPAAGPEPGHARRSGVELSSAASRSLTEPAMAGRAEGWMSPCPASCSTWAARSPTLWRASFLLALS